jgi:hypothetical protein
MILFWNTWAVNSHVASNDELLFNRYIEKDTAFHCIHYSSITYIKTVMILFWNNWVPETFSVVLDTCCETVEFDCIYYSSITYIKEVIILFWNNWEEILSSRDIWHCCISLLPLLFNHIIKGSNDPLLK